MENDVHVKTTVLPGSRIEVSSSCLIEGEEVEVTIVSATNKKHSRSIIDIIGSITPPKQYESADEVDRYIESERESWDR